MSDRDSRVVSDLNSTYLSAEALADIDRLGIELAEGAPLTVCDYDGTPDEPTWVVAKGVAHFDPDQNAWQIAYTMDDVRWEPRELSPAWASVLSHVTRQRHENREERAASARRTIWVCGKSSGATTCTRRTGFAGIG